MLYSPVARYSPMLITRISTVLKRACGMKPPMMAEASARSTARGPTVSLQYGHTRSLVVMKARQCGHMRRESICPHSNSRFRQDRRNAWFSMRA